MLAVGSTGDVQPIMALGVELQQKLGYEVALVTHRDFEAKILELGLEFRLLNGASLRDLITSQHGQQFVQSGANPLKNFSNLVSIARGNFQEMLSTAWQQSQDADAIIFTTLSSFGFDIAERLGIPSVAALIHPMRPSTLFPAVGAPVLPLGPVYNLATHALIHHLQWQPFRKMINQWRRNELDLPPEDFRGSRRMAHWPDTLVLNGFSPRVIPRPPHWPASHHLTGYWFLQSEALGYEPPGDLLDYLSRGNAPIYVGFGSMPDPEPAELAQIVVRAIRETGVRAIINRGWADWPTAADSADIFFTSYVPYPWLFPRMAGIVHHGGSGTTGLALRAGVPSLVIPYFWDQNLWASRVETIGAGPRHIARRKLTWEKLAGAITELTTSQPLISRAAGFGEVLSREDGVATAIGLIHDYLSGSRTLDRMAQNKSIQ
jgi:UDP:flavonoid glycosyltransferase YjiC (YdhE family)